MFYSHIHLDSRRWFDTEICETCGSQIEAPNAVTVSPSSVDSIIAAGAVIAPSLLPQSWADDDGHEVCDECEVSQ